MSDTGTSKAAVEWPREIWMAERNDHDQGVVSAVLSEHATIARWAGDSERDKEFHHYIDMDVYDSAEKYHTARYDALTAENTDLRAQLAEAQAQVQTARDALVECRDKLDAYSQNEYPSDHPVHVRYRQRDYAANPARIALALIKPTEPRPDAAK